MLLLAVDTSGKQGGISLARCASKAVPQAGPRKSPAEAGCEVLESAGIAGGTFSAQLVPQISGLLRKHRLKAAELDGLIAISGPGSFTGLRVGLAAVKGLAEVLRIPIVSISLLESTAAASPRDGKVLALLDAGRGEFYGGEYDVDRGSVKAIRESLVSQSEALQLAAAMQPLVVTPEAAIANLMRASAIEFFEIARPGSEAAIHLGHRKLLAGETVSIEELDANYIRRSDAEIFSKPKIEQKLKG